jgi:hypothetical protein
MANESRTYGRDRLSFSQDQPLNLNVGPASPLSGRSDSEVSRIRLTWHTVESTYQHGLRAPVVVDSTVDETVGHSQAPVAAIRGNRGQIPDLVASCTVRFPSQIIPDLVASYTVQFQSCEAATSELPTDVPNTGRKEAP